MHRHIKQAALLAALCIPTLATAAEAMAPMVVTAGRVAQSEAAASSDLTVIDREEIERSQTTNVVDLLRRVAGVQVNNSGGPGKASAVYMRGANSGQTMVLIDGVRVASSTVGSFEWAHLATADIERIEIVRGANSTLYGGDAMGGVIQIFTRKGGKERGSGSVEYGSRYRQYHTNAQFEAGAPDQLRYAVTIDEEKTRGVSAAANGVEADGYKRRTYSGHLAMPLGSSEAEMVLRQVEGKSAVDGGFPFGDVLNFNNSTKQTVGSLKVSAPMSDSWLSSVQLARFDEKLISSDPVNAANNASIRSVNDQLTWQNDLYFGPATASLGYDLRRDHGSNPGQQIDKKIDQKALFALLDWQGDGYGFNASARRDRHQLFGSARTWRVGAHLEDAGLRLAGNVGTGFKAPSINDLYWPFTVGPAGNTAGNAALKPEKSRGWDAALSYRVAADQSLAELKLARFGQRYENLIEWAPTTPIFWQPSNVGRAVTTGYELSVRVQVDGAWLSANWNRLDGRNALNGTQLARRAKESGSLLLGFAAQGANLEWQTNIVGPRFSDPGNALPMVGYHTSDLRLSLPIEGSMQLTARIDNLYNKRYEETKGYGVPGRAFIVGLKGGM